MGPFDYCRALANTCIVRGCLERPYGSELCEQHYWERFEKAERKKLYAMLAESANRVKFGISVNPKKRLGNIQSSCPVEIQLLGFVPGGLRLEQAVHDHLSDWRFHGEWFDYVDDVVAIADLIINESAEELRSLVLKPKKAKTFSEKLAEIASD